MSTHTVEGIMNVTGPSRTNWRAIAQWTNTAGVVFRRRQQTRSAHELRGLGSTALETKSLAPDSAVQPLRGLVKILDRHYIPIRILVAELQCRFRRSEMFHMAAEPGAGTRDDLFDRAISHRTTGCQRLNSLQSGIGGNLQSYLIAIDWVG